MAIFQYCKGGKVQQIWAEISHDLWAWNFWPILVKKWPNFKVIRARAFRPRVFGQFWLKIGLILGRFRCPGPLGLEFWPIFGLILVKIVYTQF